jgi:1-deoxy-D-xylulose-5-phosphate reductoisomerase
VARKQKYKVDAVSCNSDIGKIEDAVREFGVRLCAVEDETAASRLRAAIKDTDCKVIGGKGASERLASETGADTVLNSITGMAGLKPTVAALKSGKELALANKESLVTAGAHVMALAKYQHKEILPVDSEHSAIWQSLRGGKRSEVKKLILTASGGPFFGYTKEQIATVTAEQALKHPTWNMGSKITIDSATLMNKGFEIIEAAWLFGVDAEKIDVIVHRESIIHSMVEYKDNTVIAQLGVPDMRSCIQYALTYPNRESAVVNELDLVSLAKMTFFAPDTATFSLLALAKQVWTLGGTYGSALNGSNEEAVGAFLKGRIGLPRLFELVEEATLKTGKNDDSFEAVLETDIEARQYVRERI